MRGYKTLIICLFFLSIFCFSKVNALVKDYSLIGKIFYIDPGHGGRDSGALPPRRHPDEGGIHRYAFGHHGRYQELHPLHGYPYLCRRTLSSR